MLDLNLTGVFYTTHLALHHFRLAAPPDAPASPAASKQIVFVGSLAGHSAPLLQPAYAASKFGVRGLWKSLRRATDVLGPQSLPLRVNLLAPTFVLTQMTESLRPRLEEDGIAMAEVADVVEGLVRVLADEEVYGMLPVSFSSFCFSMDLLLSVYD